MQDIEVAERIKAVNRLWHLCRKEGTNPTDRELDAVVPTEDSWANRYHGEPQSVPLAKQRPPKPTPGGKVCTKCRIPQPLRNFNLVASGKGWRARCKRCTSLDWAEWRNNRRIRRGE